MTEKLPHENVRNTNSDRNHNSGHLIKGPRGGRSGVAVLTKRGTNQFPGDDGNVLHLDLGDHLGHSHTKLLTPKIYAFLSKFYFKNYWGKESRLL